MTPKQQRFVDEYLIDLNATQAATRARYSAKTANEQGARLLANVSVKAAIAKAMEKRVERTEVDQEWVIKRLCEVADRCLQKIPVLDSEGKETGEYKFEHSGANRALELLGKNMGMFRDVVQHEGDAFSGLMDAIQGRSQVTADDDHDRTTH